jgi:hypothetical protein
MAGMDLGKQIGPLPLGAWVVVVGGGLGIALWSRNNSAASADPTIVEDTSGDPGVGVGGSGMWSNLDVPTGDSATGVTYQSNEAWGQAAITYLIAQGYGAAVASSAITKALAGGVDVNGSKMSIQEWSLWSLALAKLGSPPTPVNVPPPTSVPGPVDNTPTPTTPTGPIRVGPIPPAKASTGPVRTSSATTVKPVAGIPAHWVETVKSRTDTVSSLAGKHNKSWQETWNFNLKYRNAATRAILKARGPNTVFIGTTIWVPK